MYRKLFEGESHVVFKDWKWLLITRKRDFFVSHIPVVYSQHFYLHLLFNPHSQLCSLGMILLFVSKYWQYHFASLQYMDGRSFFQLGG